MSDPPEPDDASDDPAPTAGEADAAPSGGAPGPAPSVGSGADGAPLDGLVVVLHGPRDLVNIALVIRAMKNMGLARLRVVDPGEWDEHRLEGIAHGTMDLIRSAGHFDTLEAAIADAVRVVGTTARRRTHPREWSTPEEAAPELLGRTADGPVALVFGPEDTGLTNQELDVCHELLSIPANPDHPTLNLAHAALLVFYEMRRAADRAGAVEARDLSPGKDRTAPPSTAGELEEFFGVWRDALETVGFFHGIDPGPKMRNFRSLFRRADPDRRELGLLEAAAYEVIHYARRFRARHGIEEGATAEERPEGDTDPTAGDRGRDGDPGR